MNSICRSWPRLHRCGGEGVGCNVEPTWRGVCFRPPEKTLRKRLVPIAVAVLLCGGFTAGAAAAQETNSAVSELKHSPLAPHSGELVRITARVAPGTKSASLEYRIFDPGKFIDLPDAAF